MWLRRRFLIRGTAMWLRRRFLIRGAAMWAARPFLVRGAAIWAAPVPMRGPRIGRAIMSHADEADPSARAYHGSRTQHRQTRIKSGSSWSRARTARAAISPVISGNPHGKAGCRPIPAQRNYG
jgi:hypothetical protein